MKVTSENETFTPDFITATLPLTAPPPPSSTPLPSAPIPTTPPVAGITTSQLNVRSEPSTIGDNLGTIAPFSQVQILGRESFGAWYQIVYSTSVDGKGWVTAAYVQVQGPGEVPLIETGTVPGSRMNGLVLQPVNIRSGPGIKNESVGVLSRNDVVVLTGRDANTAWLQIEFAEGSGWLASEFIQAEGLEALPIAAKAQEATAEPTRVESVTESTTAAGIQDDDSRESPVVSIHLSPGGTRAFQFTGRLSSSGGDLEDWVQFNSGSSPVLIEADCREDDLALELWRDGGSPFEIQLVCGTRIEFPGSFNGNFLLHIGSAEDAGFRFSTYTIRVEIIQR